jgi:peptidyl-prolyl cis-trans isomerase D
MLAPLRKFSSSIYAKILLGIIVVPFVFWGMGSNFVGGNKNIILTIDKDKYSIQDFASYIQNFISSSQKIDSSQLEEILSIYAGNKLIDKEIEYFEIKLSNKSLSQLLQNQKDFKRNNVFSRVEYEKFLLQNNIRAVTFENNLLYNEKKKQFLDFIGGGIVPSSFLVQSAYNKVNQKRNIQYLDLNQMLSKEVSISDLEIKDYYENNKNKFEENYKSIKLIEINPQKLIGSDEFNNIFFEKLDEIEDAIAEGKKVDEIAQIFDIDNVESFTLNNLGQDKNSNLIKKIPRSLTNNIFSYDEDYVTGLLDIKDKFYLFEIFKDENILKQLNDPVKKTIKVEIGSKKKRVLLSEIISKVNQDAFKKADFDTLAKNKNLKINEISLNNLNDDKILKQQIVNNIYSYGEKKIALIHDIMFSENYLIYVDEIINTKIKNNSDDYKKFFNQSKANITTELLNSYDRHIKKKYEIDINDNALDTIKSYYN